MKQSIARNTATRPVYPVTGDQLIFKQLKKEALEIIEQLGPKRKKEIAFKIVLFPSLYFLFYITALKWGGNTAILYTGYFLMGLVLVLVFLNIIHEAVHGTIFKNKAVNQLYLCLFDLMGANSFIWKQRHVRFHHNYPNVNHWDTDIEQSSIVRVFPDSGFSTIHQYQHIYLPLLYPFYLANWLFIRDFKDFFDKRRTVHKLIRIPGIEFVKLFLFKAIFLFYTIILPAILLPVALWQTFIAFVILLFTASLFSLIVLLSPHANVKSSFPVPGESNKMPHSWMMHILVTTNDIGHDNFFTRFFMGCFNYHVVHHIFPHINHVYYPEITKRLKVLARQYNLPYREVSLLQSLKDHYRLLRLNSFRENIFEETM